MARSRGDASGVFDLDTGKKAMQRGLGEAARSWGGSAVLGRQRGLGGFPHERLPWFPP
ncbi:MULTISPECIES: hypothetical protein [Moorena]|uniref:hypothetical protein n=1 Tax=Moorena TaxID=1155738 RepID=UPI0012B53419|nr:MULTISPECIES: hypothetical protein [Moorena]